MFNPEIYWLVIGLMLIFLALITPGFTLYFFALGGMATALAVWLTPIDIVWQLALFMAVSLVSLFISRKCMEGKTSASIQGDGNDKRETIASVLAEKGVVAMAIVPPAEGRVKCSGIFWRAGADEKIEEGEIVLVVGQQGAVVHVEKV